MIRKESTSRDRYSQIAENVGDVIWTVDVNDPSHLTFISPSVLSLLGYSVEEAMKLKMEEVFNKDSLQKVINLLTEAESDEIAYSNVKVLEVDLVHKNRNLVPVELKFSFIRKSGSNPNQILAIARDRTEQKQAQEKIERSAKEWRTTFDSVQDMISIHDKDFKLTRVNKSFATFFKTTPLHLIGKTCFEIVHGRSEPAENCPHCQTLITKRPAREEYFDKENGVYLDIATFPIFDQNGEITGSVHVARNNTARKKAELALRESEARLNGILESIAEGILVTDQGEITQVNYNLLTMLGYKNRTELLGKDATLLIHQSQREDLRVYFRGNASPKGYKNSNTRVIFLKQDGTEFPAEISSAKINNSEKNEIVTLVRDITNRLDIEEKLIISDRLASIGELASGVAHEINNPLASVLGFSEILIKQEMPENQKRYITIINNETQRIIHIVKNLLTFAQKYEFKKRAVNMNDVIQKVIELRSYEQQVNNIDVKTDFALELFRILGDYYQLQQVILNIIINAEYFMSVAHKRGTINIKTQNKADFIEICISDSGPGISKENIGHLFDPFFTTKTVGKGVGLGLSICHGIVKEHGGSITADSKPDQGTNFIITLPALGNFET